MRPTPMPPTPRVSLGATSPAPAFAVDDALTDADEVVLDELTDEAVTWVTIVVVSGGIVVAGMVVAMAVDVDTGIAVVPLDEL